MFRFHLPLAASLLFSLTASALAQSAPGGWTSEVQSGIRIFTPPDVPSGQTFSVNAYPDVPVAGRSITAIVRDFASSDPLAPAGAGPVTNPNSRDGKTASATRNFGNTGGRVLIAVYSAVLLEGGQARVIRVLTTDAMLVLRYGRQFQGLLTAPGASASQTPAPAPGRGGTNSAPRVIPNQGVPAQAAPRTVSGGVKVGGQFVPGQYKGQLYSKDGDLLRTDHIYLFPNGEWGEPETSKYAKKTDWDESGRYTYDARTGKIDINRSFRNDDDEVCLFGRDSTGKPFIAAKSEYSDYIKQVTYAGPIDRKSPEAQKLADDRAEAEARRYKWVTAPGRGIQNSQIAEIRHYINTQIYYNFGIGANTTENVYLLLKDGTVHDGLPVPPDQINVPLSRQKEPKTWGRWKRSSSKVLALWPGKKAWEELKGTPTLPVRTGERLTGRYGTGRSGSDALGGWYSINGVTFTPNNSFKLDSRGGTGSSTLHTTMTGTAIFTQSDDEGSVVSGTTPGAVVTRVQKKPRGTGKAGTYSINGWVITLRYDDGRIVRQPFFWASKSKNSVYFDGTAYAKD